MQHSDVPFITIAIKRAVFGYSCYNVYRPDKASQRQFGTLPFYFPEKHL